MLLIDKSRLHFMGRNDTSPLNISLFLPLSSLFLFSFLLSSFFLFHFVLSFFLFPFFLFSSPSSTPYSISTFSLLYQKFFNCNLPHYGATDKDLSQVCTFDISIAPASSCVVYFIWLYRISVIWDICYLTQHKTVKLSIVGSLGVLL